MTTWKRFTVDEAREAMVKHDMGLSHLTYGCHKDLDGIECGCAVTLLLVSRLGDKERARNTMLSSPKTPFRNVSEACELPVDYVDGLESGFEGWGYYGPCTADYSSGYEDGRALRSMVK